MGLFTELFSNAFPKTAPVKLISTLQLQCPEWSMKGMKEGVSALLCAAQK